jgi:hypothetical protein
MPLEEFKRFIGALAVGKSDQELQAMSDIQDRFLEALFDWWLRSRSKIVPKRDSAEEA